MSRILLVVLTAAVIATVVSQSTIDEFDNEPSSQLEERIAELEHKVAALMRDRLNDQEKFAYCLGPCRRGKSPWISRLRRTIRMTLTASLHHYNCSDTTIVM